MTLREYRQQILIRLKEHGIPVESWRAMAGAINNEEAALIVLQYLDDHPEATEPDIAHVIGEVM